MKPKYIRKGKKYRPSEILPLIEDRSWHNGTHKAKRILLDGDHINIRSKRLLTFANSLECACCGLKGVFFVKERQRYGCDTEFFHLNLYGIDNGVEILMTSDHIKPRSCGGSNDISNRQTMCLRCNHLKDKRTIMNEDLIWEVLEGKVNDSGRDKQRPRDNRDFIARYGPVKAREYYEERLKMNRSRKEQARLNKKIKEIKELILMANNQLNHFGYGNLNEFEALR